MVNTKRHCPLISEDIVVPRRHMAAFVTAALLPVWLPVTNKSEHINGKAAGKLIGR